MGELRGIADTLRIPLAARAWTSHHHPDFFRDDVAVSLTEALDLEGIVARSTTYRLLVSVARHELLDHLVAGFVAERPDAVVVNLGAGLDAMASRIAAPGATFVEIDLPPVIGLRRRLMPPRGNEVLVAADVFADPWTDRVPRGHPTMVVASGLFQYVTPHQVRDLIRRMSASLPGADLLFDATISLGLRGANRYVRSTGNTQAPMRFGLDDPEELARLTGTRLVRIHPFFDRIRMRLGDRIPWWTRAVMAVADRYRMVGVYHLRL